MANTLTDARHGTACPQVTAPKKKSGPAADCQAAPRSVALDAKYAKALVTAAANGRIWGHEPTIKIES